METFQKELLGSLLDILGLWNSCNHTSRLIGLQQHLVHSAAQILPGVDRTPSYTAKQSARSAF